MLFDKFDNRKTITGTIIALDPIHIGSSINDGLDPTQVDNPVLKDIKGNPVIPGSSLKGVIRSNFEAVLRSIGIRACDPFNNYDKSCISNNRIEEILKDNNISVSQKEFTLYSESCEVCKLFGGKAIASKLQFKDCTYKGEKCIYEIRDGVGIDRETGSAKIGAKYNFEIVPKGTEFNFYMTAENLDKDQEKYLNYILRLLQSGNLAVGGKTSRGLGRIVLKNIDIQKETIDDIKRELGIEVQSNV